MYWNIFVLLVFSWAFLCCAADTKDNKEASSPDVYRLPSSVLPEYYKLKVLTHLNDTNGFKFLGNVWIKVNVQESTSNITLHSKNLNLSTGDITVNKLFGDQKENKGVSIERTEFETEHDFFIIHLKEPLEKGKKYEIFIPFAGDLGTSLLGYYRSSYLDKKSNSRIWLAVTQFESTYARLAFPCFDEPGIKSKFEIILGHDKKYTALSNMPIRTSEDIENMPDWVNDYFEVTVPMPTYLVAYTINDFDHVESATENDVVFKIWARRDALSQTEYAKVIGPKILQYFEKSFGMKYPLPKMDMIAIPDFSAGAMENFGLITYRETALLFEPNISSSSSQYSVASVIAHELSHQWFGNLVTMKWWTDLWLNEGFATYVASLGVHYIHPEWNSFDEESNSNIMSIFKFDALKSSHPVSVQIENPNEIPTIFDSISYHKGSSIIRMMHLFLGKEVFSNGINKYLQKYKFSNAEQDNLWQSLTEEAHKHDSLSKNTTVKQIMDTWTLQTGFPIITVSRDYEKNTANIRQQRFLTEKTHKKAPFKETCWWVPLSYTTAQELDFNTTEPKTWLECDDKNDPIPKELNDLPDDDEWIIFNIQTSGLYKVKYDERNWELLIQQLIGPELEKISVLNRAALINDALDLAWTGDQDYGIGLRLIEYLKQEKEYIPWKAALTTLSDLNRMLKRTAQYGLFKNYVQRILDPIYEELGGINVNKKPGDRLDAIKHRILIASWSCRFDVGDCIEKSRALFKKWMVSSDPDKNNPVPLDFRSVVYCTAIRHGSDKEWRFLWERYTKSNVGTERSMILGSLGCTREIWLLQRYLDWTLDESTGVRKQDRVTIFSSVARNEIGLGVAKSFLFENINDIYQNLLPDAARLYRYLKPLASNMNDEKELSEFEHLFKENAGIFENVERSVEQTLETIRINNEWRLKNYNALGRLLVEMPSNNKED